jgi:hypothetical protein
MGHREPRTCCPGCCACPTAPRASGGRCSWPAAGPSLRASLLNRDICGHIGRAGLGYDRARVLFKKYTATATSGGLKLHQLRDSAATHLGHQKVSLQLIMAKS